MLRLRLILVLICSLFTLADFSYAKGGVSGFTGGSRTATISVSPKASAPSGFTGGSRAPTTSSSVSVPASQQKVHSVPQSGSTNSVMSTQSKKVAAVSALAGTAIGGHIANESVSAKSSGTDSSTSKQAVNPGGSTGGSNGNTVTHRETIVERGSSNDGFWFGYLLGNSNHSSQPIIVNNGSGTPAASSNTSSTIQVPSASTSQSDDDSHGFLFYLFMTIFIIAVLSALVWGVSAIINRREMVKNHRPNYNL